MSEMVPEEIVPNSIEAREQVVVPMWPPRVLPKIVSETVDVSALYDRWSDAIESRRQALGHLFTGGASFD